MDYHKKIIDDIELHSVEGILECFRNGVSANDEHNGEPLIYELISEYTRSPRFKHCVRAFVDHGLRFFDQDLLAVLLDDSSALESRLKADHSAVTSAYTLRCAYTPMQSVSLLHICAEFNHVACATVLVQYGADVNATAGLDESGFGGQTPIFHCVNQNSDQSADMLTFLIERSADLKLTVPGLIWGKGYEWETLIPSVNPISYTAMGLLPQMHRNEKVISETISRLLKAAYGIDYQSTNIPCRYLIR
jgi:hypothetical protein